MSNKSPAAISGTLSPTAISTIWVREYSASPFILGNFFQALSATCQSDVTTAKGFEFKETLLIGFFMNAPLSIGFKTI